MSSGERAEGEVKVLGRISSVDALFTALRDQILDGDLGPGERLPEADLATSYRIGRYTVRAAFQKLVFNGLAIHEQNRGVSVLEPTVEVVRDIYVYRAGLEAEAARVVVEQKLPIDGIVAALKELEKLPEEAPWRQVLEYDLRVHAAVIHAAGSKRMDAAFEAIVDQVMLCLSALGSDARAGIVPDHRRLVAGLRKGDPDGAADRFRAHLYHVVDSISGSA